MTGSWKFLVLIVLYIYIKTLELLLYKKCFCSCALRSECISSLCEISPPRSKWQAGLQTNSHQSYLNVLYVREYMQMLWVNVCQMCVRQPAMVRVPDVFVHYRSGRSSVHVLGKDAIQQEVKL